jgi:hypothetical protein
MQPLVSRDIMLTCYRRALGTGRSVFSSGRPSPFRRFWTQSSGTLSIMSGMVEQCLTFVEVFSFELLCESMSSTVSDFLWSLSVFSLQTLYPWSEHSV